MYDTVKPETKKSDIKPKNNRQTQNRQQSRTGAASVPTFYALSNSAHNPNAYNYIHAPVQLQGSDTEQHPDAANDQPMSYYKFRNELRKLITYYTNHAKLDKYVPRYKNVGSLFDQAKTRFGQGNNYDILIFKILSSNTTEVSKSSSNHPLKEVYTFYLDKNKMNISQRVLNAFQSLAVPIQQTLNDIVYWVIHYNGKKIKNIKLTDSDIHTRGVGVCIVKYDEGKQIVIKPEDKSFEAAVYGKSDGSLAESFNQLLQRGLLGNSLKKARIGTLKIETSKNNAHGSAVEYLHHKQFEDDGARDLQLPNSSAKVHSGEIDVPSTQALIAFSSLLGLADFHVENLVYHREERNIKYLPQLIDAEVGMQYPLNQSFSFRDRNMLSPQVAKGIAVEKLKAAALPDYGQMVNLSSPQITSIPKEIITDGSLNEPDPQLMEEFLKSMEDSLEGKSARIILIPTEVLFQKRLDYLLTEEHPPTYKDLLDSAKTTLEHRGFKVTKPIKLKSFRKGLEEEFAKGRIPFFTLDFENGEIYLESSEGSKRKIFKIDIKAKNNQSGNSFLEHMIEDRKNALLPSGFSKLLHGLALTGAIGAIGWLIHKLV